ncbi:hypothetical protein AYI70_g4399, partial [Smittium culicis]
MLVLFMLLIVPPFHADRTSLLISFASMLVGCSSSCTSFQNSLGIESIPGDFLLGVLLSAAVITSHVGATASAEKWSAQMSSCSLC